MDAGALVLLMGVGKGDGLAVAARIRQCRVPVRTEGDGKWQFAKPVAPATCFGGLVWPGEKRAVEKDKPKAKNPVQITERGFSYN